MINYIERGKALLEQKEYAKAIEFFQAAIENLESPKDAQLGLAEAYFAVNKLELGKVALFKAMTFDTNNAKGLMMIQQYCFSNTSNTANTIGVYAKDQDPVITIKPHTILGNNHYVAEQQSGNKLYFRIGPKGCVIICPTGEDDLYFWGGYKEPQGELVIPDKFIINNKSYKVVAIGDNVFYNNKNISSITLPDSIQRIGEFSFGETMISEIKLPNSLQYIGRYAFSESLIEELTIPSSVKTIEAYCFRKCNRLADIHMNEGLIQIGDNAFDDCKIHEIDIPGSVKNIGYHAFPYNTIVRLYGNPPVISSLDENRYLFFVPSNKEYLYEGDEDWGDIKVNTY